MEYLVSVPVFFLSFFVLYSLSKNDFVFIRKNVLVKSVFDRVFLVLFCAFVLSRVLYAIEATRYDLLHPLRFFYIFKYGGLSATGAYIGAFAALTALFRKSRVLVRMLDVFFLSFFLLFSIPLVFFPIKGLLLFIRIPLLLMFLLVYFYLLRFHKNYTFKDGTLSLLILFIISIVHIVSQFFEPYGPLMYNLTLSQWIGVGTSFLSLVLILINQKLYTT